MVPHDVIPSGYLSRSFQMGLLFQHPWAMVMSGHRYDSGDRKWFPGRALRLTPPTPPFPLYYWSPEMIDATCQACHSGYPSGPAGFYLHETGKAADDKILWWAGQNGGLSVYLYSKSQDREVLRIYITPEDGIEIKNMSQEFGMVAKGANPGTPVDEGDLQEFLGFIRNLGLPTESLEQGIRTQYAITPKA